MGRKVHKKDRSSKRESDDTSSWIKYERQDNVEVEVLEEEQVEETRVELLKHLL